MMRQIILLAIIAVVAAFAPMRMTTSRTQLSMKSNDFKTIAASIIGASLFFGNVARAEVDYEGVKYLGGGDKIDLNNANIRAYLKLPGLYPTIAGKIVTSGPFKTVADLYNIPSLSNTEKDTLKKYEGKFLVLDPKPEYVLDKINNGLYR
uniref:Photosystem II 12 kDa extrinsic protein n=1 Tax=Chromulina nebulosa TaxID=96789 RepID=A0A7S0SS63_9STRA|mmetsp:Transcript_1752/g.1563  ORF Transcript_1752/g.1563 Transcript_1752/m.1563 type:complete len:150 (+) Transcript_1752:43-492(+)